MKYNVLDGTEWEINLTEGNVDLSTEIVFGLLDYGTESITSISGSDILAMDFDFGLRLHLDKFEYKYETPYATPSDVASGIEFSYKNEIFEDYMSLATYIGPDNTYFATLSGSIFAPRYIRFKHTVSDTLNATTFSGAVYGFKAYNDDTTVDFGLTGDDTHTNIEIVREDEPDIRAVPLYNRSSTIVDAYVNLEPAYNDVDKAISISTSPNGPWTYAFNPVDLIADASDFDSGLYNDTSINANVLRINGLDLNDGNFATTLEYGTYTTRVFTRGDSYYNRFVVDRLIDSKGKLLVDETDPVETVEVRSGIQQPSDYLTVIEFFDDRGGHNNWYHYYRFRDRWVPSDAVRSQGDLYFDGERYSRYVEHTIFVNQKTEDYYGFVQNFYQGDSRSRSELYLFRNNLRNNTSANMQERTLAQSNDHLSRVDHYVLDMEQDFTGGMWVHFYCRTYNSSDFVDNTGFYLCYFEDDLTNSFKFMDRQQIIGNISVNYETREVWYTRPDSLNIYRLTSTGNLVVNYADEDYTDQLGGIACLPDGNLLYASGKDIRRFHRNGYPLLEYTLEDVAGDTISYMKLDPTDSNAAWGIDGSSVGRFFFQGSRAGEWDFKVDVTYPIRFDVVDTGAWVKCAGASGEEGVIMRYITKANKRVDYEYEATDRCQPGLFFQKYDHEYYIDKMPLAVDNVWGSLEWNKINLEGYLVNDDYYQQLRFTLRRPPIQNLYPDLISDINKEYMYEDDFTINTTAPDHAMWGDWLGYPNTDRVYVNTNEQALVLLADASGTADHAYISTRNRVVVARDTINNRFEVRVGYTIGGGDGFDHGIDEYITIRCYSAEEGYAGKWMGARLVIRANPESVNSRLYTYGNNNSWSYDSFSSNLNYYSGEFALYWDGDDVHSSARVDNTSGWVTDDRQATSEYLGRYFYFTIEGHRDSSDLKIHYVTLPTGTPYFCTHSPVINSINTQQLVKVEDIYPDNYKNIYVRSFVGRDLDVDPHSELDMKVRWRIPVY
jgi:hypothetical protein